MLLNGALLAEFGMLDMCSNRVFLLDVPMDTQIARLKERGYSDEEAMMRIGSQLDTEGKRKLIDSRIEKSGFGWRIQGPDVAGAIRMIENELQA